MTRDEIKAYFEGFEPRRTRTLVVVDFGNVEKWKHSLHWNVDVQRIAQVVKHFSVGSKSNRRFYYGADFGKDAKSTAMTDWSRVIHEKAGWNNFEIVTKRVKYIHSSDSVSGFEKKCDLDVEMAVDLIRLRDAYDTVVLFSGDGDLMHAIRYLKDAFGKSCIVVGARDHVGREVFDAEGDGYVEKILFAQDLEYRLKK